MPASTLTGGEDLLDQHLADAGKIFAGAARPDLGKHAAQVSAGFEHLRWLDLPPSTLANGP